MGAAVDRTYHGAMTDNGELHAVDEASLLRSHVVNLTAQLHEALAEHAQHTAAALLALTADDELRCRAKAHRTQKRIEMLRAGIVSDIQRLRGLAR